MCRKPLVQLVQLVRKRPIGTPECARSRKRACHSVSRTGSCRFSSSISLAGHERRFRTSFGNNQRASLDQSVLCLVLMRVHIRVASNVPSPSPLQPSMSEDSDEEEFVYPSGSSESLPEDASPEPISQHDSDPEPLVSPVPKQKSVDTSPPTAAFPVPAKYPPSAAQLEALHAAAASGDLKRIQVLFQSTVQSGDVEPFALANDASPRTGLTALHAASSRGYLDIVKWRAYPFSVVTRVSNRCVVSRGGMWSNAGYRG